MININSLDSPYMHVYYNIFAITVSVFELVIFFVILILDISFAGQLSESAAFTRVLKNGAFNLYGILVAVIVIGIVYLVCQLVKVILQIVIHCTSSSKKPNPWILLLLQATSLCILELIRNVLMLTVVACLNNYHQDIIRARGSLTILLMLIYFGMNFFYKMLTTVEKYNKTTKLLRQVSIIGVGVLCLLIILFNIIMLAVLKTGHQPSIRPSEIKVGLFNQTDIDNIEKGVFDKQTDQYYQARMLTTLDKILYSPRGSFGYKSCRYAPCKMNYYKRLDVSVTCTGENSIFFASDCRQAPSVKISFSYAENKNSYPKYNCARTSANAGRPQCSPGCDILSNYSIVMIQENKDKIDFAWKNFAECTPQPDAKLKFDSNFTICSTSSKFISNAIIYLISIIIIQITIPF